jgi:hypothetical protein
MHYFILNILRSQTPVGFGRAPAHFRFNLQLLALRTASRLSEPLLHFSVELAAGRMGDPHQTTSILSQQPNPPPLF